jgi:hypothetical protein
MNVCRQEILCAVATELTSANEKHPPFASLHEAYAVIKEELEEAECELEKACDCLECAWECIKQDNAEDALKHLGWLRIRAKHLAMEACQVAAMCDKAEQSLRGKENE